MKIVKVDELKDGMILATPIYLGDGDVELLGKGVVITERQVKLMSKLGVTEVTVADVDETLEEVKLSNEEQVEIIKKSAEDAGQEFDEKKYLEELNATELNDVDIEPVITNIVNANMVINVLTGEGNIPIDEKHKDLVEHTQRAFETLKTSKTLDLNTIKEDVEKAIPDMIRNNDVLMRLSQLKEGDDATFNHSLKVSILATMVGKWLGYNKEQLCELGEAALLFDIGKIGMPSWILNKPNKTEESEIEIMKKHAQLGYAILLKTEGVTNNIKYAALQHHERIDGSGYPLKLREGQIHEFAKIIMVCDIFNAMTTDRPYKKRVSPFVAAEYIQWNAGVTLDSKICYIFLKNLSVFFTGKEVLLSTNQRGRIIYIDVNFPTRPVVQVGESFVDLVKEKEIKILDLFN